jgi:dynein heavy chain
LRKKKRSFFRTAKTGAASSQAAQNAGQSAQNSGQNGAMTAEFPKFKRKAMVFVKKRETVCVDVHPKGVLSFCLVFFFPFTQSSKKKKKKKKKNLSTNQVRRDRPQDDLTATDLGFSPLEQLHVTMAEVFVPLLRNPVNRQRWPEVVANDILRHVNKFISELDVISGKTRGETRLPLPPPGEFAAGGGSGGAAAGGAAGGDAASPEMDKDTIHVLESHVIDWTHQIKNVVRGDPEAALAGGAHPGPLVELDFWAKKTRSLQSVFDQLCEPSVREVIAVLERARSSYYNAFDRMFAELEAGLTEAKSNSRHLEPLRPHFARLSAGEITEIDEVFVPMLYLISLVWAHSPHYNSTARLMVLFREICNAVVASGMRFLDGPRVLRSVDDGATAERVGETVRIVSGFKQACVVVVVRFFLFFVFLFCFCFLFFFRTNI